MSISTYTILYINNNNNNNNTFFMRSAEINKKIVDRGHGLLDTVLTFDGNVRP